MKCLREFSLPLFVVVMGIFMASASELFGQLSSSNQFDLKMALTNRVAIFTINGVATNANGPIDLFFKTNFTDPGGWAWQYRCPLGQSNLVMSNLPPGQGFFTLGITNAIRPGFDEFLLPAEDDDPSTNASLPFAMNFFGTAWSNVWVNNNGNVTFDYPQSSYSPSSLNSLGVRIIAPFWADVDTRGAGSGVVKYGSGTVNGHNAFGVDWVNVGYFSQHTDKLLSCQLIIIDRSEVAPGDFDMEFNYDRVQWEWGDANQPNTPPRAGFSDGTGDYELPDSGLIGAFLDSNPVTGLIYHVDHNSAAGSRVPGRFIFLFRDGTPLSP